MRIPLLSVAAAAAAAALPASSAGAQAFTMSSGSSIGSSSGGVRIQSGGSKWRTDRHWQDGDRRRHRGTRARGPTYVGDTYNSGDWALYNNRSWESDSYNDWWHDSPDRALPRWVRNRQNCDRPYWSGGGWTC